MNKKEEKELLETVEQLKEKVEELIETLDKLENTVDDIECDYITESGLEDEIDSHLRYSDYVTDDDVKELIDDYCFVTSDDMVEAIDDLEFVTKEQLDEELEDYVAEEDVYNYASEYYVDDLFDDLQEQIDDMKNKPSRLRRWLQKRICKK